MESGCLFRELFTHTKGSRMSSTHWTGRASISSLTSSDSIFNADCGLLIASAAGGIRWVSKRHWICKQKLGVETIPDNLKKLPGYKQFVQNSWLMVVPRRNFIARYRVVAKFRNFRAMYIDKTTYDPQKWLHDQEETCLPIRTAKIAMYFIWYQLGLLINSPFGSGCLGIMLVVVRI